MTYQDTIDDTGRTRRPGTRECGSRYDAITAHLEGERFTVLDLGAYAGYFSIRLAYDYDAHVTAVDDYPALVERCRGWRNITVIADRLTPEQVDKLGRFDVILALSVLHHIPRWEQMLEVLVANSDLLFVEPSNPAERLPKAQAHCPELAATVEALGGVEVARTAGHRSQIERSMWLVK